MTDYRATGRGPALARLCQYDVLSIEEEHRLFRRLKAARARAVRPGHRVRPRAASRRVAEKTALCDEAIEIRNRIVESNLRLVVSLAKHFAAPEHSLEELVSEAALPLIRCVESFDSRRGTRFSTYATRALHNFFAKLRRQDCRRQSYSLRIENGERAPVSQTRSRISEGLIQAEDVSRLGDRLARLSPRERTLVAERFGLTGDRRPRTFRELGLRHGLSKERVRVITCEAIGRLRESFDEPRP